MNKQEILSEIFKYADGHLEKKFIPNKTYIPPSAPKLYPEDVQTLADCVLDFWYTEWKYSERLKEELIKYVKHSPFVTLCNSGSSASMLAITALKEKFGAERKPYVITCATTFPTSITPIYQNGMMPFYVDIDPLTLSPCFEQVDYILNKYHVQGIFLAHNLGIPFDEDTLAGVINPSVWFATDFCDALGARDQDKNHVGRFADVSTLSMFPAHHVTSGEGGAVFCKDEELAAIVESLSNWGRSCYCKPGQQNTCGKRFDWENRGELPEGWDHKYLFDRLGYNLKMTDLQAALGLSQLSHIEDFVWARRSNYFALLNGLFGNPYLDFVVPSSEVQASPFGFPILVKEDAPFTANDLINHLEKYKIGTRRVFAGNIIRQPGFMNLPHGKLDLTGCDTVMNRMFWISCSPFLTDEMIEYILGEILAFVDKYK